MTTRTYCVGLPVVIVVSADGTVRAEVDLSEASDLWEGVPTNDDMTLAFTEDEVEADIATVEAAVRNNEVKVVSW